jgi:hypothetical protein
MGRATWHSSSPAAHPGLVSCLQTLHLGVNHVTNVSFASIVKLHQIPSSLPFLSALLVRARANTPCPTQIIFTLYTDPAGAGLRALHGLLGPGPAGPAGSAPLRKRTAPRPWCAPGSRPAPLRPRPGPRGPGPGTLPTSWRAGRPGGSGSDPHYSSTPRTDLVTARRVT